MTVGLPYSIWTGNKILIFFVTKQKSYIFAVNNASHGTAYPAIWKYHHNQFIFHANCPTKVEKLIGIQQRIKFFLRQNPEKFMQSAQKREKPFRWPNKIHRFPCLILFIFFIVHLFVIQSCIYWACKFCI